MDIQAQGNVFGFIWPVVRIVITCLIAGMGGFLFGMIGSMTYPGIGAIFGAILGALVFALMGCCLVGAWRDCVPDEEAMHGFMTGAVPSTMKASLFDHGDFEMIITVHKAENLHHLAGLMSWITGQRDYYVAIFSGVNPPKSTVVKKDLIWNEQFKINVKAADKEITLKLLDQDTFGSEEVGYVSLQIKEDIIDAGFPQQARYKLELGGKGGKIRGKDHPSFILSFDYTTDFPRASIRPTVEAERNKRLNQSRSQWGEMKYIAEPSATPQANYGTTKGGAEKLDRIANLQFTTNHDQTRTLRKEYEKRATDVEEKAEVKADHDRLRDHMHMPPSMRTGTGTATATHTSTPQNPEPQMARAA